MPSNLIRTLNVLAISSVFVFGGCASTPKPAEYRLVDAKEERIILLEDRIDRQEQQIEKLGAALVSMTKKLKAAASAKNVKAVPPVKVTKLAPPKKKVSPVVVQPAVESAEDDLEIEGEKVADSRHEAMQLYFEGLRRIEAKQLEHAIRVLSRFVRENPTHIYADRAQALIAESHAANKDYGLAVLASNVLESRYPNSVRLPEIIMLRAKAYIEMGQMVSARATLRDVMKRFPSESVADLASRRLAELAPGEMKSNKQVPKLLNRETN